MARICTCTLETGNMRNAPHAPGTLFWSGCDACRNHLPVTNPYQIMYAAGHRAHSLGKKDKPSGPAIVVTSFRVACPQNQLGKSLGGGSRWGAMICGLKPACAHDGRRGEPGITMQSPEQVVVAMIWEWLAKDTETTLQKQSCMQFGRHSWSLPAP
jgi:hypothetical protein